MLDQLTHLHRLQIIAEEGSLRRASEKLHLTQPALSRSLSLLEAHFGQALLERHARGIRPTAFGERVLAVSRRMARQWQIADQELKHDWTEAKATLRVGAGPVWRSGVLSAVFVEMQRRFPFLTLDLAPLREGRVEADLAEGHFDVVFGSAVIDPHENRNLVRHFLAEVSLDIMAVETHPAFARVRPDGTLPEAVVLEYPWINYSEFALFRDTTIYAATARLGGEPNVRMVCSNLLTAITMLQKSECLSILPDLAVRDAYAPAIRPLPISLNQPPLHLGIVHRDELSDWPPLKVLVELCRNEFHRNGGGTRE